MDLKCGGKYQNTGREAAEFLCWPLQHLGSGVYDERYSLQSARRHTMSLTV